MPPSAPFTTSRSLLCSFSSSSSPQSRGNAETLALAMPCPPPHPGLGRLPLVVYPGPAHLHPAFPASARPSTVYPPPLCNLAFLAALLWRTPLSVLVVPMLGALQFFSPHPPFLYMVLRSASSLAPGPASLPMLHFLIHDSIRRHPFPSPGDANAPGAPIHAPPLAQLPPIFHTLGLSSPGVPQPPFPSFIDHLPISFSGIDSLLSWGSLSTPSPPTFSRARGNVFLSRHMRCCIIRPGDGAWFFFTPLWGVEVAHL